MIEKNFQLTQKCVFYIYIYIYRPINALEIKENTYTIKYKYTIKVQILTAYLVILGAVR